MHNDLVIFILYNALLISGPVVYVYFSIVKREKNAPSNLPAVLLHVLEREEDLKETEEEFQNGNPHSYLRNTFILKTIFVFLPATYPIGWLLLMGFIIRVHTTHQMGN